MITKNDSSARHTKNESWILLGEAPSDTIREKTKLSSKKERPTLFIDNTFSVPKNCDIPMPKNKKSQNVPYERLWLAAGWIVLALMPLVAFDYAGKHKELQIESLAIKAEVKQLIELHQAEKYLLVQRIQNLENESLASKVEVKRLTELYHAPKYSLVERIQDLENQSLAFRVQVKHLVELNQARENDYRTNERVVEKRLVEQNTLWSDADQIPVNIPTEPIKENNYCNGDSDSSTQQIDSQRKKTINKNNKAPITRVESAESKFKNSENVSQPLDAEESQEKKNQEDFTMFEKFVLITFSVFLINGTILLLIFVFALNIRFIQNCMMFVNNI